MKNLLILIALCSVLFACRSVKKIRRESKSITDSSAVESNINTQVKKTDSLGTKDISGDYTKETIYNYDTVYQYVTEAGRIDTVLKYVPRIIKVVEKGKYNMQQTARQTISDSAATATLHQVSFQHTATEKATKKEVSGMLAWMKLYLFIAAILFAAYLFFLRKKQFKI